MTCKPELLMNVPLFALFDDDETAVLASQVEVKTFAPHERIYKAGKPAAQGLRNNFLVVRVTTVDEDQQEVVVDTVEGDFSGSHRCSNRHPTKPAQLPLKEIRMPGGLSQTTLLSASAEASRGNGSAHDAGSSTPRGSAVGAAACQSQPK